MKRGTAVAALGLLAALSGFRLVDAQAREDCRTQRTLELVECRNQCIDSRDLDGCLEQCDSFAEDCLSGCRWTI